MVIKKGRSNGWGSIKGEGRWWLGGFNQWTETEREREIERTNRPTARSEVQGRGSFWAYIVSQDASDSKSNCLHVDIFRFCFTNKLGYILLQIHLKRSVVLLKCRTSTGYFSNSAGSSVTNRRWCSPSSGMGRLLGEKTLVVSQVQLVTWRDISEVLSFNWWFFKLHRCTCN